MRGDSGGGGGWLLSQDHRGGIRGRVNHNEKASRLFIGRERKRKKEEG